MKSPFTTRISSRGQIVIPGPVRKALGIEPGTPFLVIAKKDTVVLHRLQEPPWQSLRCHGRSKPRSKVASTTPPCRGSRSW